MATVKKTPFELSGSDSGPLRGDVRTGGAGADRPVVVVCHGFKGFKDWGFFPFLAERLAKAGMTAISFNFSGSGVGPDGEKFSEPDRFAHNTYSKELADLGIVWDAVRSGTLIGDLPPARSGGLVGHSFGGAIATLFSADHSDVKALVTWAAVANPLRWDEETIAQWRASGKLDIVNSRTGEVLPMHLDMLQDIEDKGVDRIVRAAERVAIPWLIVHGDEDESVSPDEARRLYDAVNKETAELNIIAGGGHTFGARHPWAGYTVQLEQAMDRTVGWFSRHIY